MRYKKLLRLVPVLVIAALLLTLTSASEDAEANVKRFYHMRVFNGSQGTVSGVVLEYPSANSPQSMKVKVKNIPSGGYKYLRATGCIIMRTLRVLVCLSDEGLAFQTSYPRTGDNLGNRTIRNITVIVGSDARGKVYGAQLYIRLSDGNFVIRTMKKASAKSCAKEGFPFAGDDDEDDGNGGPTEDDNYPFVNFRLRNANDDNKPVKKAIVRGFKGSATEHTTEYVLGPIPSDGNWYENELEMDEQADRVQITVVVDVDMDNQDNDPDDVTYYTEYDLNTHDSACFIEAVQVQVMGQNGSAIAAQVEVYPEVWVFPGPTQHPCTNPDPFQVPVAP